MSTFETLFRRSSTGRKIVEEVEEEAATSLAEEREALVNRLAELQEPSPEEQAALEAKEKAAAELSRTEESRKQAKAADYEASIPVRTLSAARTREREKIQAELKATTPEEVAELGEWAWDLHERVRFKDTRTLKVGVSEMLGRLRRIAGEDVPRLRLVADPAAIREEVSRIRAEVEALL